MSDPALLTRTDLEAAADLITGGRAIESLPRTALLIVVTIGQYLLDRGLAELERRGELQFEGGDPVVPYCSDHMVECALTRPDPPALT